MAAVAASLDLRFDPGGSGWRRRRRGPPSCARSVGVLALKPVGPSRRCARRCMRCSCRSGACRAGGRWARHGHRGVPDAELKGVPHRQPRRACGGAITIDFKREFLLTSPTFARTSRPGTGGIETSVAPSRSRRGRAFARQLGLTIELASVDQVLDWWGSAGRSVEALAPRANHQAQGPCLRRQASLADRAIRHHSHPQPTVASTPPASTHPSPAQGSPPCPNP